MSRTGNTVCVVCMSELHVQLLYMLTVPVLLVCLSIEKDRLVLRKGQACIEERAG